MRARLLFWLGLLFWAGFSLSLALRFGGKKPDHRQPPPPSPMEEAPRRLRGGGAPEVVVQELVEQNEASSKEEADEEPDLKPSLSVHAFYYPWYRSRAHDGAWKHWNHEHLPHWEAAVRARHPEFRHDPDRGDVGAAYFPKLGAYSSNDVAVVRDHVTQLKRARVGVLVVSWYPDTHNEQVDEALAFLLDAAAEQGLEVCVHLEPYEGRTAKSARRDVDTLLSKYGKHRAYHRFGQKPVFYAYDSYHIAPGDWAAAFEGSDVFLVGLVLDEAQLERYVVAGPFSAGYSYFGATGFTFCSTPAHWTRLAQRAKPKLFVPCVAPGYDDRPVRPWNGHNARARDAGKYYDAMWQAAIDARSAIVGVTSFNEWHEGTQIEEAVPFSWKDGSSEEERPYADYAPFPSSFYLDKTRLWVSSFLGDDTTSSSQQQQKGGEAPAPVT